jgi:hypothetical protein
MALRFLEPPKGRWPMLANVAETRHVRVSRNSAENARALALGSPGW